MGPEQKTKLTADLNSQIGKAQQHHSEELAFQSTLREETRAWADDPADRNVQLIRDAARSLDSQNQTIKGMEAAKREIADYDVTKNAALGAWVTASINGGPDRDYVILKRQVSLSDVTVVTPQTPFVKAIAGLKEGATGYYVGPRGDSYTVDLKKIV